MANSLVAAFRQIRLNSQNLTTAGIRLQLGSDTTIMASETGQFASAASVAGFATTSALNASGQYLLTQINTFSGSWAASGINIQTQLNALVVKDTALQNQINGGSGNLIATGAYLDGRITTDIANLVSTGAYLDGRITTDVANLVSTGSYLDGRIQSANTNITALQNQINSDSGHLITTGQYLDGRIIAINSLTGTFLTTGTSQSFVTVIPTGVDNYFVQFPANFPIIPKVQVSIEVTGDYIYFAAVRGRTVSGYVVLLSDIVQESGVTANTFASI